MGFPTAEQMWTQVRSGRMTRRQARAKSNRIQAAILMMALDHFLLVGDPRHAQIR